MKNSASQRFHLTFAGQLLPDTSREQGQLSLARFFGLSDPQAVAVFFSGREVPLRRNLERGDAFRLYRQLRAVGLICEVRPVPDVPSPGNPELPRDVTGTNRPAPAEPTPARVRPSGHRVPAPNLFALRPAVSALSRAQSREQAELATLVFAGACAVFLLLTLALLLRFPAVAPPAAFEGPLALASLANNELLILTPSALLLHERSGLARQRIPAQNLGLERLAAPLGVTSDGDLLLNGAGPKAPLALLRCRLEQKTCAPFLRPTQAGQVTAVAQSLLGDALFLLSSPGYLLRSNLQGEVLAQAALPAPWGYPRVFASDGLLLIPDAGGPLLGIHRPETDRFAEQLDALLIMPDAAVAAGLNRIQDVAITGQRRWALLAREDAPSRLFAFDNQWGDGQPIILPAAANPQFLHVWRDKLLLVDPTSASILRYSLDGQREADFASTMLAQGENDARLAARRQALGRRIAVGIAAALVAVSAILALLNGAGLHALRAIPQQRTALLDPMPAGIEWQRREPGHAQGLATLAFSSSIMLMLGASFFLAKGDWSVALMLLPAIIGGQLARWWLKIGSGGHLGFLHQRVVAVDYAGRYFYGDRRHLRGNQRFVFAPALVLTGSLPELEQRSPSSAQNETSDDTGPSHVGGLATLGLLWRLRHPWLRALLALAGGWVLSGCGLLLI